jgi:hypothetical protein
MIGADNLGGANGFNGAIDEVRIYSRALTAEDIQTAMIDAGGVLVKALAPSPMDGSVEVPRDVVLSWAPGDYAATHDLYFGTSFEDVNQATRDNPLDVMLATDLEEPMYALADLLDYGQTYYWRVDEVNDAEPNSPWVGNVWSFTALNFLVVDDFESYNDEDNVIYETWIDGWVNGTGSTVGYIDPPYAEQSIVHRGDQSMPLLYNNFFDPYYSQADREWEQPQDWTNLSPVSLTLWIRGNGDNTAEPFYAAVADSAGTEEIIVHDDSTIIQTETWQAWDTPLSTLSNAGLDLTSVTRLSVGVGNVLAPSSGFNGTVYVDDVRLMLP